MEDWELSEEEKYELAKKHVPSLTERLREISGDDLDEEKAKEYGAYWFCSRIDSGLGYKGISRDQFIGMSQEDQLSSVLLQVHFNNRGVENYNRMAGESLTDLIEKGLAEKGKLRILDIGCGGLKFLKEIGERYRGQIERHGISNEHIDDTNTDINFVSTLAEVLPRNWTDYFDVVTCFEASMYFYDRYSSFQEALRVTAPDGVLFYGDGGLKSLGNSELLERILGVKEFEYTVPEELSRKGETYNGIFGKWVSKAIPLWSLMDEFSEEDKFFEFAGKRFKVTKKEVPAWCSNLVRAQCLGKQEEKES